MSFGFRNSSLEIDAAKLKEKLDSGEDVFILDVRTPEEYDAWRLSYDKHDKTPLIPIDRLFTSQKMIAEQIPKDKEIITLCAHGNRSMMAAQMLSRMGYKVKSVRGGMVAWNQVYDVAEVQQADAARVWQLRRVSKGCMSYVIAVGNEATVIDSTSDLESSVLKLVQDNGLEITNVVDTHMHADHVSGFSAIVKATGAQGYLGAKEGYELLEDVKVSLIDDGHKIPLGDGVSLEAIHAPGHTDGSMCFALKAGEKTFLFTGDTLFVNGVGRPDLRDKADEFAGKLYDTYQKILKLPDDTVILPAHFDPNSITIKHGEPIADTVGAKRNVELLSKPKDEFVKFVVSSVPPRPSNYRVIIQINKQLVPYDEINIAELEAGPNSCGVRM
ncbi:MBL fold metallo-hydrolase [Nitrososphaera sp.]|uniref:MBL fold metallo-hydrolase n=1 Tax=Nitrososphaera sp. TaxID=1971748 RepID=UPI0017DCA4AF|nr:MBL fold metallo-hydrolase [Nitrososphaera sp.]NWG38277.1 MBL fold metallo-hydrolase [Nitrososphaera sp.]